MICHSITSSTPGEERGWDCEAEGLGCLEIDRKLDRAGSFDCPVGSGRADTRSKGYLTTPPTARTV
jgi:hypothetical protein